MAQDLIRKAGKALLQRVRERVPSVPRPGRQTDVGTSSSAAPVTPFTLHPRSLHRGPQGEGVQ